MRMFILSVLALAAGYFWQQSSRPGTQQLEAEATAAWNSGNATLAEQLARQAVAQDPAADRALDVLTQVALHEARPELHLAVAEARRNSESAFGNPWLQAGDVALSYNLLKLAEVYWGRALSADPQLAQAHHRLVTAAGLRLDPEAMERRLLRWCDTGSPSPEVVLLYLSAASIDGRDASAAEGTLRASLEADSNDLQSRYGLARCLIILGRDRACESLLADHLQDPVAATLLAQSRVAAGRVSQARASLPESPPDTFVADYWSVRGALAAAEKRWTDAEDSWAQAVRLRPLSKTWRSRYCEALRRSGNLDLEQVQVKQLETIVNIVTTAQASSTEFDAPTAAQLADWCIAVGAVPAAKIIAISAEQMSILPDAP